MARSNEDLEAIKRSKVARFFGTAVRLAPPEVLIVRGLAQQSVKGWTDVAGILDCSSGKLVRSIRQGAQKRRGSGRI